MISRRGFLGLVGGVAVAGVAGVAGVGTAEAVPVTPPTILKWNRSKVYVLDKLGAAWPVREAVEAWDDSSLLDLARVSSLPSASVSYIVVQYGKLPTGTLGVASRSYDSAGRICRATVTINNTIRLAVFEPARRLALVRHEIGHCLGFNHTSDGTDVMEGKIIKGGPTALSQYHKDTLRRTYGR